MLKSKISLAAPTSRKLIIYLDTPVKKRPCSKNSFEIAVKGLKLQKLNVIVSSPKVFFDESTLRFNSGNHQFEVRVSGLEELFYEVEAPFGKMPSSASFIRNFQHIDVSKENETNEIFPENILESTSRSLSVDENFMKKVATIIEARSLSKRKQQLEELFKNLSALQMSSEPNLALSKIYNKEVLPKIVTTVSVQFYHIFF